MKLNSKIFYGWWVVFALIVIGMLGPMARYTITTFGPFISQEMGWGATQIGLALSISLWVYAFASIPVGWLLDRFGSQRVITLGGILLFIGLLGFSKVSHLWQLYTIFGLAIGIGVSMTHFLATQSTARKWFAQRAGLAGGILTAAFWVGPGLLSPFLTIMSNERGWRSACLIYAVGACGIITLLAVLVVRDTPEALGLHPDGIEPSEKHNKELATNPDIHWDVRDVVKTRTFWMAFFAYSLVGIPGQGLFGHLILWGVELGAPKATAGFILTSYTLTIAFTSVVGGWLADRIGKRSTLIIAYALSAVVLTAGWLIIHTTWALMVLIGFFGLMYGISAGPGLWAAYVGDLFGRSSVGKLFGIMTLGYGLIGGSGPLIWGKIYDVTGTYNLASLFSAVCFVLILLCVVGAKPVKKRAGSVSLEE